MILTMYEPPSSDDMLDIIIVFTCKTMTMNS